MEAIRIKEFGKVITGKTPSTKKPELFGDSYPFITPSDISSYDVYHVERTERGISEEGYLSQKGKILPPGAVCYVCIGSTVGKICLTEVSSFTNQQLNNIIVDKEKFVPEYVYYRLRYETPRIQSIAGGTGSGKAIYNKTAFEEHQLDVHDYVLQQKIASILSAYDDFIENNTRRIQILEEMAQRIYREWFVDFRFPGHEKVKFINSEIGKIPGRWEVKRIAEILEHHIGGGWGKDAKDGKYSIPAYVIRGTDIPDVRKNNIVDCSLRYHTESNFKSRKIESGDVVFEVSGGSKDQPVGRALLINPHILRSFDRQVICASFCKLMRVNQKIISPELFYLKLLSIYEDRSIYKYQVQSTGISNFKFEYFLNNETIIRPTDEVQEEFGKIAEPIFNAIALFGQKNMKLREARDILLPKLISGEIDVSEIDIAIREQENGD